MKKFIVVFVCLIWVNLSLPCFSADTPKNINESMIKNDIDFAPYMKELQRSIKSNWHPPTGLKSTRVVLFFTIAKDGKLLTSRIYKSSGNTATDAAALKALKSTAPFRPLPEKFKGSSIDVQFYFDYNAFFGDRFTPDNRVDYTLFTENYESYTSADKVHSIDELTKKYEIKGYK